MTRKYVRKDLRKYWYYTTRYVCVLCGRENVYKDREYIPRPDKYWDRNEYKEDACDDHFM